MAISDLLKPERYTQLKEEVKAEMLRRKRRGSVVEYGSAAYDYNVVPEVDKKLLKEHYEKLITPLRAVSVSNLPSADADKIVTEEDMALMEAKLLLYKQKGDYYHASSGTGDCDASCTGLCVITCSGICTGTCSGSCRGDCGNSCSDDGCTNTCEAGCAGNCADGCTATCGGCSGECTAAAQDACLANCEGSCLGYCYAIGGYCPSGPTTDPNNPTSSNEED